MKMSYSGTIEGIEYRKENFFQLYKDVCDSWIVYNNSHEVPAIVAKGNSLDFHVYNNDLWNKFTAIKWAQQILTN